MEPQHPEPTSTSLTPRSPKDVAERVLALLVVINHAAAERPTNSSKRPDIPRELLSPAERAFLRSQKPSFRTRVQFSWRAEALVSLLWALKLLPSLRPLNRQIEFEKLLPAVEGALKDPASFVAAAVLRKSATLETAEQDLFHQHWRVRDAELFGKPMPRSLDPDVVCERRYGLSWVVGWGNSWDDVPMDT